MSVGEVLKKLRKERGLTQSDVATALHVNRSTYTKYEIGTNVPNIEQLKAISVIFNVSVDDILKPEPKTREEAHVVIQKQVKPAVRSDHDKLLGVYDSLDDESKNQLMSVAYLLMSQSLKNQGIDVQQMVEQQLHKVQNEGGGNNDD